MSVLVGKKAPGFKARAVIHGNEIADEFSLDQYIGKKYVVLFFYPKDFTFVCPTELHAFQNHLKEFEERNVVLVGCSTDTEYSHLAWLQTPRNRGGIKGITYPIIADTNKTISYDYDVLAGERREGDDGSMVVSGELVAYRGLFLIDREGLVQHQVVNNMPLGRSVKETLRMVDTLQHSETHGEVCPANWEKGQKAMKATSEAVSQYLESFPKFVGS